MAIKVACLIQPGRWRARLVAHAMAKGIRACGDEAVTAPMNSFVPGAKVCFAYGWKCNKAYRIYPTFIYADLGYFDRETSYRLSVNGWSPESYVRAGLPSDRLAGMGQVVLPWNDKGREIVIAGSSRKAAAEHGFKYMEWETQAARSFHGCGYPVVYRPKPKDKDAVPIIGLGFDTRPLDESFRSARALVTHHSNSAIDALMAGVPVHCAAGAAAAFSVPLAEIVQATRLPGRAEFLADVAWLEWSVAEMESGAAWMHLKERGLVC